MLDRVRECADDFDVLHFHIDPFHFPLFRPLAGRTLTTLHGRQDLPDLQPLYFDFKELPLVSISNSQRAPIQSANFVATIYHGVPLHLHQPTFNPSGGYLAFLGRISPEKGVDRAIKVAQRLGIPLKIAAKVDRTDEVYFHEKIRPLLKGPGVQFIGEINEQQKSNFLGQALALMFLIDWPEPFGLSMIEAMACGTPVLALRHGSVEEVVEDGLTGHIVNSIEQAAVALPRVMALNRHAVRRRFEERFTATRMTNEYVRVYNILLTREDANVVASQVESSETAA
jgi:glycosyltransferase involved in cell wall biosynthesis